MVSQNLSLVSFADASLHIGQKIGMLHLSKKRSLEQVCYLCSKKLTFNHFIILSVVFLFDLVKMRYEKIMAAKRANSENFLFSAAGCTQDSNVISCYEDSCSFRSQQIEILLSAVTAFFLTELVPLN